MRKLIPLFIANGLAMAALYAFVPLVGPLSRMFSLQEIHAGILGGASNFMWMLFAPFWGKISDKYGRRRVIMEGAVGFALTSFLFAAWSQYNLHDQQSFRILFGGALFLRIMEGALFSALPVASMAYIADVIPEERRTAAMGGLGAAVGIGLSAGPALSGLLTPFGFVVPLYALAAMPLIALFLIAFFLPAEGKHHHETLPKLSPFDRRIIRTTVKMFLTGFAVTSSTVIISFFVIDRMKLPPEKAATVSGYALTSVGVTMFVVQSMIMKLPSVKTYVWQRIGGFLAGVGLLFVTFVEHPLSLIAAYVLGASGCCMIFPSLHSEITFKVDKSETGAAVGRLSSSEALAGVLAPIIATLLYRFGISIPYIVGGVCLLLVSVFALFERTE